MSEPPAADTSVTDTDAHDDIPTEGRTVDPVDTVPGNTPMSPKDIDDPPPSKAPDGQTVETTVTFTKTVKRKYTSDTGTEVVHETTVTGEFEEKLDDEDTDFINDLVSTGWTPRGNDSKQAVTRPRTLPKNTKDKTGKEAPPRSTHAEEPPSKKTKS